MNQKVKFGWHLIREDEDGKLRLSNGDKRIVKVGQSISILIKNSAIQLCNNGLHASQRISQACKYHCRDSETWLCFVAVWGDLDVTYDKFCGRHRMILAKWRYSDLSINNIPYRTALKDGVSLFLKEFIKRKIMGFKPSYLPKDVYSFIYEKGDKDKAIAACKQYHSIFTISVNYEYIDLEHILSHPKEAISKCFPSAFDGKYRPKKPNTIEKELNPIVKKLKADFIQKNKGGSRNG